MGDDPFPIEFLGRNDLEIANKCRQMAAEASALADVASTQQSRDSYLDLQRRWNVLADEIENAPAQDKPIPVAPAHPTNQAT